MYIFSGISGSKVADVAAVGTTMRDMLDERKYPRGEVVAVLSASAIMGETIPPSIVLLVLGSITTLSTTTLFVAGLLPAALLGCVRHGPDLHPGAEAALREEGESHRSRRGARPCSSRFPRSSSPSGWCSGSSSGLRRRPRCRPVAVAYAFILAFPIAAASAKLIWSSLLETTSTAGMVLFIIAAASPFAQTLATAGVSAQIGDMLSGLGDSPFLFMLITIILLIIMGQLLEGLPAVLIFAPLLLPIAVQFGINPVQYVDGAGRRRWASDPSPRPPEWGSMSLLRRDAKPWRGASSHF